ncbi:flagellar biosynthetic protein FliO [Ewingella americana]|nr:flagellar biosynthetic protein FliO [Ewingella americana]KAA8730601.1 flagellar biosynthetic protein FliO [Ewingella americana]
MTPTATHGTVQQQTAPAIPTGSALTQVSTVLGGILLLILLIGWVAKRLGFAPQTKNSKLLKVTASCQVGRSEKVVIVEVDNTWLVLGVTSHQITPLHTLSSPPVIAESAEVTTSQKPIDFAQLLTKVLKRPGNKE